MPNEAMHRSTRKVLFEMEALPRVLGHGRRSSAMSDFGHGSYNHPMKRFAKIICTLIGVASAGLATDYLNVIRKERQLSDGVSQCGGRVGSIPFWPLGTEYRITLASVPSQSQSRALAIANQMRGWVGITFKNCEINKEDGERLLNALPNCDLFVEQDGRITPVVHSRRRADEPPHAPESPKRTF